MTSDMTEDVKRDLEKLSAIPDEEIWRIARHEYVKAMAKRFVVPVPVMEIKLEGVGPFQTKSGDRQ